VELIGGRRERGDEEGWRRGGGREREGERGAELVRN